MHHERETSPEIQDLLKQLVERNEADHSAFGPTGRFPEGKLTPNDEGELRFGIATYKGKVIVNFGSPVASLGLSADQAIKLARSLRWHASKLKPARKKRRRGRR